MDLLINNIPWKIKFIPESNSNLRRNDGSLTIGMTDNGKHIIYVNKDLNPRLLKHVLCHELVHAYCYSYGIYMNRNEEEWLARFIADYGYNIIEQTDAILSSVLQKWSGYT